MLNSFEPQTPFEGWMKATLEGLDKRIDNLSCNESFTRLSKLENKVANIEGKASLIGAIFGVVGAAVTKFLWGK